MKLATTISLATLYGGIFYSMQDWPVGASCAIIGCICTSLCYLKKHLDELRKDNEYRCNWRYDEFEDE